ncbi:uncharacterized protein LOC111384697 [Olea europaea var. sylvestris]|uniref:uncharacterized protein LOC111384697 n=1 Tax=Olea europaea var. sylvestris TaxID=158386 RepID=UPI000C1D06CB|nr:uncharacterized protein LOC111384697 [Olea europaea var. sylvestris]
MVDASAGESIMAINVDDAYELYERIAENQSMWPSDREVPRKTIGIYKVDVVTALTTQMKAITRKLDSLTHSVNMVQTPAPKGGVCGGRSHYCKWPFGFYSHRSASRDQIVAALAYRAQGTLPRDTEKNPKEQVLAVEAMNYVTIKTPSIKPVTLVRAYVSPIPFPQRLQRQPKNEQVQAITTRSGVQLLEITVKKKEIEENRVPISGEEQVGQFEKSSNVNQEKQSDNPQVKAIALSNKNTPLIPLSQRLQNNKMDKQFKNFWNTLRQLHINIPFIDVILQIPNYAKFLKEMLTEKRKLPEHETITLTEECSAIIQKLRLGDPKAASIILQLADQSLKGPYGIVEDMLIKVGKLIFPVDFITLDIEEASQMSIILGRPFLSTSRALLDFDVNEIVLRVEDKQ